MPDEEYRLLKENNYMLKLILGYILYKENFRAGDLLESFIINLAADKLGGR